MNGLLYKNMRLNRLYFILSAIVPMCTMSLFVIMNCATTNLQDGLELCADGLTQAFFLVCAVVCLALSHSNTIACDESKKWAHFIVSSPKGAKGQVLSRYTVIFLLSAITAASAIVTDLLIFTLIKLFTDADPNMNIKIVAVLFFAMIFVDALELPFLFRFGSKRGAFVKMMMGLVLIIAVMIYLLFGPLPEDMDGFMDAVMQFIDDFRHGITPKAVKIFCRVFPFVSLGAFVISYFISCKFYLKGVESYDK